MKDNHSHTMVKLGRKVKGLYQVEPKAAEVFFTQTQQEIAEDTWHQRLAHTNLKTVKILYLSWLQ